MSNLHFQCKPAPIHNLYKYISILTIVGIFCTIMGILAYYGMKKGWAHCSINDTPVECSEIWWVPWVFIGVGIVITLMSTIASRQAYLRATKTIFRFYTDYIECYVNGRCISKYNIQPNDHVFISPQTRDQEHYHVATILIKTSSPIEISSLLYVSQQPYMVLPNIPHYQQVYQQICDLYHITPEKS